MSICGECGTRNAADAKTCIVCGSPLDSDGEADESLLSDPLAAIKPVRPRAASPTEPVLPDSGIAAQVAPAKGAAGLLSKDTPQGGVEDMAPPAVNGEAPPLQEPTAVLPEDTVVQPPPPIKPPTLDRPPAPGELICGNCGAGNAPSRKFCRRCASSLAEAEIAPQPSWWTRLTRGRRRTPLAAGTRPKRRPRRFPTRLAIFVVVIGLIAGGAYAARDWIGSLVLMVQDEFGDSPVTPLMWNATSSAPDHEPERAGDGISNRYWAPEEPGDGVNEVLSAEFAEPFRLVNVVISSGASKKQSEFLLERRPTEIRITTIDTAGARQSFDVTVQNRSNPQEFFIGADGVMGVDLMILKSTGPLDARVAIAEVEYFGRAAT